MVRRLLIAFAIFLIAILIAADRVGAVVGAHVLASKLQSYEHLPSRPSASIRGIPFLTQAVSGTYSDVKITARDVPVSGVNVTTLTADLHNVHLPFRSAVRGHVDQVPVDRVTGTAFVSFSDANSYLAQHRIGGQLIELAKGANGAATVFDTVHLGGQVQHLRGIGTVSVLDNVVAVDVTSLSGVSNRTLQSLLSRIDIKVPLRGLPFRIELESISVTPQGLSGTGAANHIVLGS